MAKFQKISLLFIFIIGVIFQVLPVIRSGLLYDFGYGFWGPNGHDGIWHLSLINHISNLFVIPMPTFSGSILTNYHPFFDIALSLLSRISFIPASIWLFQIFPILTSSLLLYLSYQLGKLITSSHKGGLILMFLSFSSNSFGWLYSLIKSGSPMGESIFWAMQSPSNQINPPFNLSLIFLLLIFIILIKNKPQNSFSLKNNIFILILLILLPVTKAYSAVVGFGFFSLYALYSYFKYHRFSHLILFFIALISSYFVFSIYNPNPGSILTYHPFWFINSMIDSPDKIFWPKLSSFRYTLESLPGFDFRLIIVYIVSFFIFIIGNFAWRLLGLIAVFKKPNYLKNILLLLILINTLIPTLFIQKGTSWNTIQFLYYALFLGNILLTLYLSTIKNNILLSLIFLSNIIGLIGMLPNYLGRIPPSSLPVNEIKALQFLRTQPTGTVLTVPYNAFLKSKFLSTPIPLYAYETTAYVASYSGKPTFVDDEMNLDNSGFDYRPRLDASTKFWQQLNIFQDRGFLLNNNISYIYIANSQIQNVNLTSNGLFLKNIYQLGDTTVFQVLK